MTQSWFEQLTKDHTRLLALLHVRSEYEQQQWAAFDTRSARKGYTLGSGPAYLIFNANAVIMQGEEYGKVKKLDVNAARSFEEVGYPRAWLTIAMQHLIALWLVAVVDELIVGAPPSGNMNWKAMVAGSLQGARIHCSWSSYEHQEFAPPSAFDPEIILRKARGQLNMLFDELEILQTSPEAMRQYVMEEKANTAFKEPKSKEEVWQHVSQTLVWSWTNEIERWQHLVAECEHLKTTIAKSGIVQVAGAHLPKDVDTAMRRFGQVMQEALQEATAKWMTQIRTVDIKSEHIKHPTRLRKKPVGAWNLDLNRHSDRILSFCFELSAKNHPFGYSWRVGKLKEQLEGTTYSTGFANWMTGIDLMDELHVLWSFRQTIDQGDPRECDVANLQSTSGNTSARTPIIPRMFIELYSTTSSDLECTRLLRRSCDVPLPRGCKDKKWLEKMIESRQSLTELWTCIRKAWNERQLNMKRSDEHRGKLLSQMSFDLSHDYVMKVAAERRQLQVEDEFEQSLRTNQKQGSEYVQQAWDNKNSTDGAVRKTLTKKSNAVHNDEVHRELGDLTLEDERPANDDGKADYALATVQRIAVKQDTLSVMSKIFSTSDGLSGVRWNVLSQALADAGLAVTPGAGSAMSFANEHGTISIHKPHDRDGSVANAVRLRGIGRRLGKWFGWSSETFALREKGDDKSREDDGVLR